MVHHSELPAFDKLPKVEGLPQGCAWGVHDHEGKRDSLGTLNLLTPDVVLAAKSEIQTGISVALNWGLENIAKPGFNRLEPNHKIKPLDPAAWAHDDEIHINTQSGSQWDGFKHWAHQSSQLYYNNLKHADVPNTLDNGIHHWSNRGGIVARGVLLDYVSYAAKNNITYKATDRHEITVADLDAIAAEQKVELRPGDVLIVRSGMVKWYNGASDEEREAGVRNGHTYVGVEGTEKTVRWLWDHHFAAIAGDAIAFEAWPPSGDFIIHDWSLAMWGEPIGELWDLEKLAETCQEQKRWSFFLTSAPLNVKGGVASPPNALAIF